MRIGEDSRIDAKLQFHTHLRKMDLEKVEQSEYLGVTLTSKCEEEKNIGSNRVSVLGRLII